MSLRRQSSKQHKLLNEEEDLIKPDDISSAGTKDIEGHSLLENYAPNMILSQSTGVERRFENSSSIQNSLGNEIHDSGEHMASGDTFNELDDGKLRKSKKNGGRSQLGQNIPNSQSTFPTIANIGSKDNNVPQHNFSTSISSLTNNLRRAAPESFHGSRMNNIFHKKGNQNLLLRSNDLNKILQPRPLHCPTNILHLVRTPVAMQTDNPTQVPNLIASPSSLNQMGLMQNQEHKENYGCRGRILLWT